MNSILSAVNSKPTFVACTLGIFSVKMFINIYFLNYRIEQIEKFKHNFWHDVMGDGQKHNDQVFAHSLCEICSG